MTIHRKLASLCLAYLFSSGCVSVSLPTRAAKKAADVKYVAPGAPFEAIKSNDADEAWVNQRTGNTISFMSECTTNSDSSLEQMESDGLNVMTGAQVLSEQKIPYNGREAIEAVAEGQVDGVAVQMKLLSLKKNNCNYTLTYTGVRKSFPKDLPAFDSFVASFRAP